MRNPYLSICIPTYNFGAFIGETLESIVSQATDDVEIIVVDGASTDNTPEVVRNFQRRFPGLSYRRLPERGGIDRDMAISVDLAKGEYCWLFSADDTMEKNSIGFIKSHLRPEIDFYLCGLTLCDFQMNPLRPHPVLNARAGSEFDLSEKDARIRYFSLAETTTAFFSFMSSIVFRKQKWDEVPLQEDFVGSCWAHVARVFRMIPGGLRVKYLGAPVLSKRGDNDSFLDRGLVHRLAIGIDGFNRLADAYFGGESVEAFHIRRVLRNEHSLLGMIGVKSRIYDTGRREELAQLDRLVGKLYRDPSLPNKTRRLAYKAAWGPFLKPGMDVYRNLKKILPLP
jgi:abequosyltransferase